MKNSTNSKGLLFWKISKSKLHCHSFLSYSPKCKLYWKITIKLLAVLGCIKTWGCCPGLDPAASFWGWIWYIKRIPPGWVLCPGVTWGATDTWLGKLWGGGWCILGCGLWWWCPRGNCAGCPGPGGGGGCCILMWVQPQLLSWHIVYCYFLGSLFVSELHWGQKLH